jgi:hypothetical protein
VGVDLKIKALEQPSTQFQIERHEDELQYEAILIVT